MNSLGYKRQVSWNYYFCLGSCLAAWRVPLRNFRGLGFLISNISVRDFIWRLWRGTPSSFRMLRNPTDLWKALEMLRTIVLNKPNHPGICSNNFQFISSFRSIFVTRLPRRIAIGSFCILHLTLLKNIEFHPEYFSFFLKIF